MRDTKRIDITLSYCFVFTSVHERWARITLRKFIRSDEERRGRGLKSRDGELVRRASDKRTRQLRGSATGARDGKRVLYLIFATYETHSAPHVSRSALGELCCRSLPLRRIALRGIDFRSVHAFARYETRPIITEDSRNNDGGRGRPLR